jgi:hypothetical protein
MHNVGERTGPCSIPACFTLSVDTELNCLWERNQLVRVTELVENFDLDKLHSKPGCHVILMPVSTSKITAAVNIFCLNGHVGR